MKIKPLLLLIALSLVCANVYSQSATQTQAEQAIVNARVLWNKTKVAGHEWNTIKPLVTQAKQALDKKDYATAITLAQEASAQSELALIQAEHEKTNWQLNIPK